MKKNFIVHCSFFIVHFLICMTSCNEGVLLYVSPEGNDANSGAVDEPLQTMEGARKAVYVQRTAHPGKKVTVYFKEGVYPLEQTVRLSADDSGSEKAPVVYSAMKGEMPIFTGGKSLTQWTRPKETPELDRLEPHVRDKIYVCDLTAAGITRFGDPTDAGQRPELICNGQLQTLARWPNKGFVHAGKAKGATELPKTYINVHGTKEGVFEYIDNRMDRWAQEEDIRLGGYW